MYQHVPRSTITNATNTHGKCTEGIPTE